jgi:hypothetical protein
MYKGIKGKIITYGIMISLLSLTFANITVIADSNEEKITYKVHVDSFDIIDSENGQEIIADGFGRLLIPGNPNIPSKIFSLAIPPGAKVINIDFIATENILLPGIYDIIPCPLPEAIGDGDPGQGEYDQETFDKNYEQVYSGDDPYPASIGEFISNANYRKYDLVDVRINPFTYYPASKQLEYYPEITVEVTYEIPDEKDDEILDNLVRTESFAEEIIANYDDAQDWYQQSPRLDKGLYDYVIITLDSLTSAVTSLVDWETSKGRNVNVVTTSWIDSNYIGWDLEEKMRNFLREKYPSSEWGIEDVCLIGDYDDVPIRFTSQAETDYYYAELSLPDDQSWDADGDHIYGENYGDTNDFYGEVNVGRIPYSDVTTVSHICDKSVAYEQNNDDSYKKNILLLGSFFWSDTDNAVLMEYKTNPSYHPWMSSWTATRLYEQGYSSYPSDYDISYSNVESVWSSGTYAFVNYAGHGSPTACYRMYPSSTQFVDVNTCNSLNDDYPAIIFADACSNHETEQFNIGQAMMGQGGVGFLGSTEVAYGTHGWNEPSDGSSETLDYFFTTCVTSGNYTQGQAHQWSLTQMYQNGYWYYDKLETFEWGSFLGNPNLGMMSHSYSTETHVTNISSGWNFVSLPFQISEFSPLINKAQLQIKASAGITTYNWASAVTEGLVSDYLFGWDKDYQTYVFSNELEPGNGYWLYAYEDCTISLFNISKETNPVITTVDEGWNVISAASDQSIIKNDIIVNYNDTDYSWSDATSGSYPLDGPLVSDYFFGWDRTTQTYVFSDVMDPGYAYWMYSYEPCMLKRSD